ncbi:MAG: hypothetical protein A2846_01220 [Candidatus Doudnabacteria bacterium RIFCSPHIGHO2_01_FULL_49_9]|uniref:DoxX family protein n=1 Tax=Candidatus Doudnabacteria bacterium RIFCSPHIGHO2_01_FULL_49_9 TaxID=1817827 RepID=A0A1F5P371_9BACT|nr:MAG: hypothetical protein A2846_01220 [Candidatus Doudnabacteria bacterium RIFCSPHIGHO2_01_FULL_49_9]
MFDGLWQYGDTAFWIMQAVIGAIFIVHAVPKLKNPAQVASVYGAPSFVGTFHGALEIAAGVALIVSQFVEIAALVVALIIVGAIYFKIFKWKMPFMAPAATGWEFDLILLAAALVILTR